MNLQLQARNFYDDAEATVADHQLRYEIAFAADIVDAAASTYDVNGAYGGGDASGAIVANGDSSADDVNCLSEQAVVLLGVALARVVCHWQVVGYRYSFVVGTCSSKAAHAVRNQLVHSVVVRAARHSGLDVVDSYDRIDCLEAILAEIPEREWP